MLTTRTVRIRSKVNGEEKTGQIVLCPECGAEAFQLWIPEGEHRLHFRYVHCESSFYPQVTAEKGGVA